MIDSRQEAALKYLYERRGTFVKSTELAKQSGFKTTGTREELRESMRMATFSGHPVIARSLGFMWAVQENQVKRAKEALLERVESIKAHAEALGRIEVAFESHKDYKETSPR